MGNKTSLYTHEKEFEHDRLKDAPPVMHFGNNHFYAIFRIDEKYKSLNSIKGFERHMERKKETLNADTSIENEILIGSGNVTDDVNQYIKDVKLRKNSVIARGLLITASPNFFKGLIPQELEAWKEENIRFLKKNYGDNCVYATLHKDESTWHIHALIVPKFINEKTKLPILSNTRYFDGIDKMRAWQDNYAEHIRDTFKQLNRGIKYSKAKHLKLKQYYALINQQVREKDIVQLTAKAISTEFLNIKLKAVEKTLEVYKKYNSKNSLDKVTALEESKTLLKEVESLNKSQENYKETISILSEKYKIPQYVVKDIEKDLAKTNTLIKEKEFEREI